MRVVLKEKMEDEGALVTLTAGWLSFGKWNTKDHKCMRDMNEIVKLFEDYSNVMARVHQVFND